MSRTKNGTLADTCLMAVASVTKSVPVRSGEAIEVDQGVFLSARHGSSEVLLEVDSQTFPGPVTIDQKPMHEIAAIHPGQLISLDGQCFVVLRHLQAKVIERQFKAPFSPEDADLYEAVLRQFVLGEGAAPEGRPVVSKARFLLRAFLLAGVIAFGLLYFLPIADQTAKDDASPSPLASSQTSADHQETREETGPLKISPNDSTLDSEVATETAPATKEQMEAKVPTKTESPEPEAKATAATKQSPEKSSNRSGSKSAAIKDNKGPRHPAYGLIQEYRLEARFDPVGARRKLTDLIKTLEKGSQVRADAEAALQKL